MSYQSSSIRARYPMIAALDPVCPRCRASMAHGASLCLACESEREAYVSRATYTPASSEPDWSRNPSPSDIARFDDADRRGVAGT